MARNYARVLGPTGLGEPPSTRHCEAPDYTEISVRETSQHLGFCATNHW